ncbi:MAG: amidohydrolase [Gemmatimonadota bacterium]
MSAPAAGGLLVVADRVLTLDGSVASAPDAVLVRDGRVAAIGRAAGLRSVAPDVDVHEFPGGSVLPGLTDSHIHLTEWALALREADLSRAGSPDAAAALAVEAAARTDGEWVRGRGWDPHRWGGTYPDRSRLDATLPDRPVVLQSHDMHALWVNGEALRRAGIGAGTADPEGGRILRDDAGEPTGVLLESAGALVTRVLPAPEEAAKEAAVLEAQARLHAWGITGVHAFPSIHIADPEPFAVLESLRGRDRLRLRVLHHLPLDHLDRAIADGVRSGDGDDWIRVGGVKMFLDGALGSRTAWMREPYAGSTDRGVQVIAEETFRAHVIRAAAAGIATTVHAIGDAAVARALDVLAAVPAKGLAVPHRIEHVQCCPPDRLTDAGRAGIVCSVQPSHLMTDWPIADRHWGASRARTTYAFRSLAEHGAVLAFGSDAPVEPADPRLGLHAAVRRTDLEGRPAGGWQPAERLGIDAAFRGYTIGPAIVAGRPHGGRITVGAPADFAVWAGDPLRANGSDLLGLQCMATVVGGERVHG